MNSVDSGTKPWRLKHMDCDLIFTEEMKLELISGLKNILIGNLEEIILYGSVARGNCTEESDVDIVLICRSEIAKEEKDRFLAWNAEMDLKYNRVFSIVDIERSKFERWISAVPFYKSIQKEGVILWKAA
ncbi:MAG: nucleotidyltransferase domain-containing protein [Lachnospiraceae bacterium]|nr:nucleotidyltransferase domain-containing protein [Lachnospiraceae bacterium]